MTGVARPGLCSVTFRHLGVDAIVAAAASAGLEAIEWGGDVHVPPGDVRDARRVRALTADAGLGVASYGSYARAGVTSPSGWRDVVRTAAALGAPRVRVWAGAAGSADVTPEERAAVVEALREGAAVAEQHGVVLATEFHKGTLADSVPATLALLAEVDRPALGTYWQPPEGMADAEAISGLHDLAEHIRALHVFSWWPGSTRLPLTARSGLWREAFGWARGRGLDAFLEFVPDDDVRLLPREAAALRELCGQEVM